MTTFIIQDKEQFKKIQARFKERSRTKCATPQDHVFYNVVRGKALDRGFSPATNSNKLVCNYYNDAMRALTTAKTKLKYGAMPTKYGVSEIRKNYGDLLTEDQWAKIVETVNG